MSYTNSPLISFTKISPNKTVNRKYNIDTITIHCVVGQVTVERLGEIFSDPNRNASSNYGVGKDGRIGMYVEEKDRSWCSSNASNDHRAVTIEVASDSKHPYAVTDDAYKALIKLVADICKRNGKKKILWFGNKAKTLAYSPKPDEMVMTVHRWFANKSCPGDYLYNRHGQIAAEVNKLLNNAEVEKKPVDTFKSYLVKVSKRTPIKTGPGYSYGSTGKYAQVGVYTIVEEKSGWGKLKSGIGWISLDQVTRL